MNENKLHELLTDLSLSKADWERAVLNPVPEKKMVYIVAAKQFMARDYARRNGLRLPDDWTYVYTGDVLRGRDGIKVVVLSGWSQNIDSDSIREMLDYLVFHKRAEVEYVENW